MICLDNVYLTDINICYLTDILLCLPMILSHFINNINK